jgi:threonine/homoserine/homoserine lactone efflux protein
MNPEEFALFALASLLLNITPGADMLYVASRSTSNGTKAGMISALGITAGCFVHILAAALGLSVIIMQSAWAFEIIKYTGAAYLIYLGIKSLIYRSTFDLHSKHSRERLFKIFIQGAYTNIFNPKVAMFFLAFLPQFIAPSVDVTIQTLLLGFWFNFSGLIINMLVALLFGKSGNYFKRFTKFKFIQEKITGSVLIYLGCRLAFMKKY